MDTADFVRQLRNTAKLLEPFSTTLSSGSKKWNGAAYVETEATSADPAAQVWFSILTTIAALIEAQGCPVTPKQFSYLDRCLLGGMGSLNDISLGSRFGSNAASSTNERLDKQRRALYESFMQHSPQPKTD
jgi:hypothetical protein